MLKVMAVGGAKIDNMDELSSRLENVHLDLMEEEDNYVCVCTQFLRENYRFLATYV